MILIMTCKKLELKSKMKRKKNSFRSDNKINKEKN